MRLRGLVCAAFLLWLAGAHAAAPPADLSIELSVVDPSNQPIPGVRVELKTGQATVSTAVTDPNGHARFTELKHARYIVGFANSERGFASAGPTASSEIDEQNGIPEFVKSLCLRQQTSLARSVAMEH